MNPEDRARRIVKNETLFRDVNDRVKEIDEAHGAQAADDTWDFLCECGDPSCTEALSLTRPAYEDVRSDPLRFVVLDGHEQQDVERVVVRGDGYVVVEKTRAEQLAVGTDPRS